MIHGILPVDKPGDISSAQVVRYVKKLEGVWKTGHMGTLDPFATGLLLVGVNKGTKLSRFFLAGSKRYTARLHLGIETDTLDRTGSVVEELPLPSSIDDQVICRVVEQFRGLHQQVPPVFSALKHNGKPLYRYAREGKAVEKPPRDMEIFDIRVERVDLPYIDIDVTCSGGTYIRTLARDIGKKLGACAHLAELRRTESCGFSVEDGVDFKSVVQKEISCLEKNTITLSQALSFLPAVKADPGMEKKVKHGQRLSFKDGLPEPGPTENRLRVIDRKGRLSAVVKFEASSGKFNYCCVFSA